MKKPNNVIAIIGATATGKSSLAIELAKKFDTEIISADSRLVYKDFDVGTAKPSKQELKDIKHHCIDIVSPKEDFSVTEFKTIAQNAIENLFERGKVPIIAGGTGFYVKALLEGFSIPQVKADEDFREKMRKIASEKGNEYLYSILKSKDAEIAKKLHFNDIFRVIRA
jgi:tRNA dimethylallyltransferase